MKTFGNIIKNSRIENSLTLSDLMKLTFIDTAILSKIEKCRRVATKEQVTLLVDALKLDKKQAITAWLSDKIINEIGYEEFGFEALKAAENQMKYTAKSKTSKQFSLSKDVQIILAEIDKLHNEWIDKKPLNKLQLAKMIEFFSTQYTYNSNQIEGNTLTFQETHLVVNEGLTISGKSVREHLEAVNHNEAVTYLSEIVADKVVFSEKLVKDLHYIVLKAINREYAGKYRDIPVRITGSEHVPCQPFLINKGMEDVFVFYENNKDTMHPVILAAEMHEQIVSVHPFLDGNGRTSRLVMNLMLLKAGFPIANIKGDIENRMKYYAALEACRKGDKTKFYLLVAGAAKFSLEEHLGMVG
jgi:Fic family protein